MEKLISYSALRKALGEALRPMRGAIYVGKKPESVEFMGYRFDGLRLYKVPGQVGFVWKNNYSGKPCASATQERWPTNQFGFVSGTLDECATQLHARLLKEFKESRAIAA